MFRAKQLTKRQLLKVIGELQAKPGDRFRVLGEASATVAGAGLGAAAAGTAASIAGVTAIPVLTTAASWIGVSVVAATPVGWIAGAALAGGALTYGISRLVRSGAMSEGRKRELLNVYQERLSELSRQDEAREVDGADRTNFICALRELVEKDVISPDRAFRLLNAVLQGSISLSQAHSLMAGVLQPHERG